MPKLSTDELVTTLRKYFKDNKKSDLFQTRLLPQDQTDSTVLTKTVQIKDLQDVETDIVKADRISMRGFVFKGYVQYQGGMAESEIGDPAVVMLIKDWTILKKHTINYAAEFSTLLKTILPLKPPAPISQPNPQPSSINSNESNTAQTDLLKQILSTVQRILDKL